MEPRGVAVNMQCTPPFPPPFPFLLVLYSHFLYSPYLKLPPSFIVLFSSRALSHIVSHSIMFLLGAFTFSFYQRSLFSVFSHLLLIFSPFFSFAFLLGSIPTHPPPPHSYLCRSQVFSNLAPPFLSFYGLLPISLAQT